jgi:hypothetical protein
LFKKLTVIIMLLLLAGCSSSSPLNVMRGLFGYIEPPPETTIPEELRLEFDRCVKIGKEKNCAQAAYDVVRTVKGLEPRTVPKGFVIILEGDGNSQPSQNNEEQK